MAKEGKIVRFGAKIGSDIYGISIKCGEILRLRCHFAGLFLSYIYDVFQCPVPKGSFLLSLDLGKLLRLLMTKNVLKTRCVKKNHH